MERSLDSQLDELKRVIQAMGVHVEKALFYAASAMSTKNLEMFEAVHKIEHKINQEHLLVDQMCMNILAKQGPVARDLRLILSIVKINTDLERMGDQVVNISYIGKDYLNNSPMDLKEIIHMFDVVKVMVKDSLDCFVGNNLELAKKVLLMDDEVDQNKDVIYKKMTNHMKIHSQDVESALHIIFMAKNLERLGDHSTNIAEDVIFALTGKDIRHGGELT